jgi:hypothetical protein
VRRCGKVEEDEEVTVVDASSERTTSVAITGTVVVRFTAVTTTADVFLNTESDGGVANSASS